MGHMKRQLFSLANKIGQELFHGFISDDECSCKELNHSPLTCINEEVLKYIGEAVEEKMERERKNMYRIWKDGKIVFECESEECLETFLLFFDYDYIEATTEGE